VCLGELPALLLILVEQAHVFDSDNRLAREGCQQFRSPICEWLYKIARHQTLQSGSPLATAAQQASFDIPVLLGLAELVFGIRLCGENLYGLAFEECAAGRAI
jgi:hypothetical protein